jgi:hypothetical protein
MAIKAVVAFIFVEWTWSAHACSDDGTFSIVETGPGRVRHNMIFIQDSVA